MARRVDTRVRYHIAGEEELRRSAGMRDVMQRVVDAIAEDAQDGAPKRTGRGAASIHGVVEAAPDGWRGRVSWTPQHWTLKFHELGWRHKPARPFLRPALERRREIT